MICKKLFGRGIKSDKEVSRKMHQLQKSKLFYEKCIKIIPAASSTLAKSPKRLIENHSPYFTQKAKGAYFTDIDGNEWLDCEMAMGTVVWGHSREEINNAVIQQINDGCHYSTPGVLELKLAEQLLFRYPKYNSVKFFKNGSDSVYSAVRAARYLTGKEKSLSLEYHGWLDWSVFQGYRLPARELGVPDCLESLSVSCSKSNLIETIKENSDCLACVVICPASYTASVLQEVQSVCRSCNIVLIFDEVTSGIRYGYGGVTYSLNLSPDVVCISKGLTNGLPLAVAIGCREIIHSMERIKISNAHSGENLALAAALACEKMLYDNRNNWPSWRSVTSKIIREIDSAIKTYCPYLILEGNEGCFSMRHDYDDFWKDPFREYLIKHLAKRKVFSKGYILFSDMHSDNEISLVGEMICESIFEYSKHDSLIHNKKS